MTTAAEAAMHARAKKKKTNPQQKSMIAVGVVAALTVLGCLLAATGGDKKKGNTSRYVNDASHISSTTSEADGNFTAAAAPFFESLKIDDLKYVLNGIGSSDMVGMPGAIQICDKDGSVEGGALPSSYDTRTEFPDCIAPIQDQGNCSASYAIAAARSLSSRFCIADGSKVHLSSQQILSCDKKSSSCNGGNVDSVWAYIQRRGLYPDECLPYAGAAGAKCNTKCTEDQKLKPLSHCVLSDPKSIKREIQNRGPVVATMDLTEDLLVYSGGVYTPTEDTKAVYGANNKILRQVVTVVGFGTTNGVGYWIVGNSWGTGWGEQGFAKIAIKARVLGSAVVAVPATAEAMAEAKKEEEAAAKRKEEVKRERILRDERIAEQKRVRAEADAAKSEEADLEELDLDLEDDGAEDAVPEPETESEEKQEM